MTPEPIPVQQRESLRQISAQLLRLHKLLLDGERGRYEQKNGPISSPGEFLNLVLSHEQFEWLRQLSGLIVQIDETLSPRSRSRAEDADSAEGAVRRLLAPGERGDPFQRRYWEAVQASPEILIAHRELINTMNLGAKT